MELFCSPQKLSLRFVVKIPNRVNFGALHFLFSGVLQEVFFSRPGDYLAPDRPPGMPLWARIRIGDIQENDEMGWAFRFLRDQHPVFLGVLIQFEISEILIPETIHGEHEDTS
jgi:hypothetical protein